MSRIGAQIAAQITAMIAAQQTVCRDETHCAAFDHHEFHILQRSYYVQPIRPDKTGESEGGKGVMSTKRIRDWFRVGLLATLKW